MRALTPCRGDAPDIAEKPLCFHKSHPSALPALPTASQGLIALKQDQHRQRESERALTCVSMCWQQARNSLHPRYQQVFGEEVKYRLQGLVGLQGILQVALLHHCHVFVL